MLFCLHVEFVFMLMSFNWLTDDLLKDNPPSKFGWSIFAAQICLFCEKYENPRNLGIVWACADKSHLCSASRKFSVNLIWLLSPDLFVDLFTSSYWRRREIGRRKVRLCNMLPVWNPIPWPLRGSFGKHSWKNCIRWDRIDLCMNFALWTVLRRKVIPLRGSHWLSKDNDFHFVLLGYFWHTLRLFCIGFLQI